MAQIDEKDTQRILKQAEVNDQLDDKRTAQPLERDEKSLEGGKSTSKKPSLLSRVLNWHNAPAPKKKLPRFFHTLYKRVIEDDIGSVASVLAYHVLMAVFPLMLVLIQGISYFIPDPEGLLLAYVRDMPQWAAEILGSIVETIAAGASTATITVGLLAAIWSGSRGIEILIKTINHSFGLVDTRNIIAKKAVSVGYTILLMLFIMTSLLFSVFSDRIISIIQELLIIDLSIVDTLIDSGVFLVLRLLPYLVLVVTLTFFYRMAPSTNATTCISFSEAFFGGTLATLAIFLVTWIYAFVVENISNLSLYYGSLAGILSMLIWLLWICQIIVLGAEFVAAFCEVFKGKKFSVHAAEKYTTCEVESNEFDMITGDVDRKSVDDIKGE